MSKKKRRTEGAATATGNKNTPRWKMSERVEIRRRAGRTRAQSWGREREREEKNKHALSGAIFIGDGRTRGREEMERGRRDGGSGGGGGGGEDGGQREEGHGVFWA